MNIRKSTILALICVGFLTVSSSGVAVLSISNSAPTFTASTQDGVIDISTDKSVYKQGETVTVIITNIGETRIEVTGPCFTVYNEHGETVFSGCLFWYLVLESGESETWCWNQKDMEWKQVPKGKYTVEGSFPVVGDKKYVDNASFYIKKGRNPIASEQLINITQWLISIFGRDVLPRISNL